MDNAYKVYREHTIARTALPVDSEDLERTIKDLKRETRSFREEAKRKARLAKLSK